MKTNLKTEINDFNKELLFGICKNIDIEKMGNLSYAINAGQKKIQNKFIKSIKDQEGNEVFTEKEKREVIRDMCSNSYNNVHTDPGCIDVMLQEIDRYPPDKFKLLLGAVKKKEVYEAIQR